MSRNNGLIVAAQLGKVREERFRQDPVARALLQVLPAESFGFFPALVEMLNLRTYGITITPELAKRVGERFAEMFPRKFTDPEFVAKAGEVVYYMRIGNRVKIGTTANLKQRLADINPEELMAVEPGSVRLERMRHREFGHLRTHGEWFRYRGMLVEHIAMMQRAGQKPPESSMVDTAALAEHLAVPPAFVLRLAEAGIITPVGTRATAKTGRPSLLFDLNEADVNVKQAVAEGRVVIDHRPRFVRK